VKLCNGVFEGGGVRGIGHVGAACGMEAAGYRFVDLAGSSAGAIVAALLAAGYGCRELKQEMERLDYRNLKGKEFLDFFGPVGKALSVVFTLGIYNTDYLEKWLDELLERKNKRRFSDVEQSGRTLKITASDLTDRKLLVFPDALPSFGLDPGSFPIAKAVRMSVSIPVFFEPVRLKGKDGKTHLLVDGGLLSNYPMWVLDDGTKALKRPTFGFKFYDAASAPCKPDLWGSVNLADYLKALVSTCMDAYDNSHVTKGDYERTIKIPTEVRMGEGREIKKINGTDFDITEEESRALFENGRNAAEQFLARWDFEEWKRRYRNGDGAYASAI